MKNAILCLLATVAVTLSLAFRVAPAPANPSDQPIALPAAGGHEGEIGIPTTEAFRDSLFYGYYSQTLGVDIAHSADKSLIETVAEWLGTPYRGGGSTAVGTDCSGFVMRVYKQAYGVTLVHSSGGLFQKTERVKRTDMREGDLVFFRRSKRAPIYHVGIYLNDGKFIHSASGKGVVVSSLNEGYWHHNFCGAGRVRLPEADQTTQTN